MAGAGAGSGVMPTAGMQLPGNQRMTNVKEHGGFQPRDLIQRDNPMLQSARQPTAEFYQDRQPANIKPLPNVKGGGQMYAGGTPNFDERTGMAYLGGSRDFDESANPGPFQNQIGGGTPASGGKGGGVQAPVATPPQAPQPTSAPAQAGTPSVYQQAAGGLQQAMGATQREMGFQPSRVQGFGYQVGDVTGTIGPYAGDISAPRMQYAGDVTGMGYTAPSIAQNIGQFVNPFEQQVVSGALGDIERQRQMQANQLAAQFQGARAFGGSRQAIQEAELARSAMEQGASTAAALRQQGFGQALQAAGQQAQMGARAAEFGLGQGLQAQLANQAARQRFGEFGAQQGMQAALANQAARQRFGEFAGGQSMQAQLANQAAQARAREFGLGQSMQAQLANQAAALSGSQQRMGAASQLANLANLGFGMGQTVQQQMAQQGAMQQQLQQQIMNAARQQFEGFRNYPAQALGYYAQALGATPTPQSSTTSRQPGLFDYLTLGASLL